MKKFLYIKKFHFQRPILIYPQDNVKKHRWLSGWVLDWFSRRVRSNPMIVLVFKEESDSNVTQLFRNLMK